jgi:mannosyltransferase OCH1-like enzyme
MWLTPMSASKLQTVIALFVLCCVLFVLSIVAWTRLGTKVQKDLIDVVSKQTLLVFPNNTPLTPKQSLQDVNIHQRPIPQCVHFIKCEDQTPFDVVKLLPGWQVRTYTIPECRTFVSKTFFTWPDIVHAFNLCAHNDIMIDLFKYLVVYDQGGLFIDKDVTVNQRFQELLEAEQALVSPYIPRRHVQLFGITTQNQGEYQSWWVMAPPKSAFLWQVIWQVVRNIFTIHTQGVESSVFTQISPDVRVTVSGGICYTYVASLFKDDVKVCSNKAWFVKRKANVLARRKYSQGLLTHLVYTPNRPPTKPLNTHKIAAIIHQTHERRWVTPAMAKAMQKLREHAPYCEYRFYDASERLAFIKQHYPRATTAYQALVPGAFQADLFRVIVVYTTGGVYFDSGMLPEPDVDLFRDVIDKADELVFPIDKWMSGLYNAFVAGVAGHPYLKYIIEHIINTVSHRKYFKKHAAGMFKITGPKAYADALQLQLPVPLIEGKFRNGLRLLNFPNDGYVYKLGRRLYATKYALYYEEQNLITNAPYYKDVWKNGDVYNVETDLTLLRNLACAAWPNIPAFYINLDRSLARRKQTEHEFQRISLKPTRIKAIDGAKFDPSTKSIDGVAIRNDFQKLTRAGMACTASHLKAIKTAFDSKCDYALICEDDVSFTPCGLWLQHEIKAFLADITNSVGIVLLYWAGAPYGNELKLTTPRTMTGVFSLCSYIITRKGMLDVLSHADVSDTSVHLRATHRVQQGEADNYIYALTNVALSGVPLALADNMVHKTVVTDRFEDHDAIQFGEFRKAVRHLVRVHVSKVK